MIRAADLFAGAGGMSTGLMSAAATRGAKVDLVAVNHWPIAVATHTENHPAARHYCTPVEALDPRVAIPRGRLDLLMAAPECTHHSTARGGKPINDQSRASAWHIMRWIELLRVDAVLIENVPEFRTWGPLGANGRPLQSKRGQVFEAFLDALRRYGYTVEHRVLNAADFGAATTRKRLFILALRGKHRTLPWPTPTHARVPASLFSGTKKWRAAREILDWSLPSQSIFTRKRPLQPATMRRIIEGLRRFGGPALQPFVMKLTHGDRKRERSVDEPLPTITTAHRGELGLIEPFVLAQQSGGVARSVDDSVPTVATDGAIGLVQPFIASYYGDGGHRQPRTSSVDDPLPTAPTENRFAVVEPFIVTQRNNNTPKTLDEPVPALCTGALAEPFLTRYYGSGSGLTAASVDAPLDTVTTKARFGLCQPVVDGYVLDIRFRMLQPHELAGAMSFPKSYVFTGNKGDQIRQIGNAVDCSMSRALCGAILDARAGAPKLRRVGAA